MSNCDKDFEILPVVEFKNTILQATELSQIVICIGETGSGKTTQIPQFFLDAGLLSGGLMAITQPRKIAAITVAQRVCRERNTVLGEEIGYTVRFDNKTTLRTKVNYMTDGILIRECLSDHMLSRYQVIMLDEAHERSLHTDILFGLIKAACAVRPSLRLIVTSATLDTEKFGRYFNNCPILRVPGRVFPVDIYHSKTRQVMSVSGPASSAYIQAAVDVVLRIHRKDESGHILVFLTGQEEIERACALIRAAALNEKLPDRELVVLPLYAALSSESQALIFENPKNILRVDTGTKLLRKCVVATNIAETSITVPQVRFVVDAGYVKQKTYDAARGMESLVVVPISKV